MAPRLSKRQQRELEELEALGAGGNAAPAEEKESEEEDQVQPARSGAGFSAFLALGGGDQGSEDEDDAPAKSSGKSKKSKKKKKGGAAASATGTGAAPSPRPETPSAPTPTSDKKAEGTGRSKGVSQTPQPRNEKKALKKAKAKERKAGKDEFEQALAELSIKYPELQNVVQLNDGASSSSTQSNQAFYDPLSVSLQHLDGDAEMRRFFGAKVVQASKSTSSSSFGSSSRRKDAVARSNLTRPKNTWWPTKLREGLSLRQSTEDEVKRRGEKQGWTEREGGEKWWIVEYSKKYKVTTRVFLSIVLSGDPNGFWELLSRMPYHADTLLQVSEVYRQREEYSQAVDLVDRALFAYERAFIGSFNFTNGNNRLDFDYVENRPFFLAVHRQIPDLQRRGCVRTAFEFARLLYSLDPWSDPHGSVFHLDFLALKAPGMQEWFFNVYDFFDARRAKQFSGAKVDAKINPAVLPGWMYARALALWMQEDAEKDSGHGKSTKALIEAIKSFPSVVPLLADKIESSLPASIRGHSDFTIEANAMLLSKDKAILHLLSHLYAQRSSPLWKDAPIQAWFTQTVTSLSSTLPSSSIPPTPQRDAFLKLYSSSLPLRESVYRHVAVLESAHRSLLAFLPKEITSARSLQCDPIPPSTKFNAYDNEYFASVGDDDLGLLRGEERTRRGARRLEQMIPDAAWRQQLQALYDANPELQRRFPGGLLQLAQALAQVPHEMIEDIFAAQLAAQDREGMQMPGHLDDVLGQAGAVPGGLEGLEEEGGAGNAIPREGGDDGQQDANQDEDDDGEEEEPAMPWVRNLLGRFFGRAASVEEESSDDSGDERQNVEQPPGGGGNDQSRDQYGVD
ncbi:hypothetical protein AX16_008528 [Volvariella volvacea WC 439]|nr:hypothetical protein AX16_008528 [Volvariella volvacea WC 439]